MSGAAGLATPKRFTVYVAVPCADPATQFVDLQTMDTEPLLACLARNSVTPPRENRFDVVDEHRQDRAFPVCASNLDVMTLGYFAYKKPDLMLLEISAVDVVHDSPPIEHPIGLLLDLSGFAH